MCIFVYIDMNVGTCTDSKQQHSPHQTIVMATVAPPSPTYGMCISVGVLMIGNVYMEIYVHI